MSLCRKQNSILGLKTALELRLKTVFPFSTESSRHFIVDSWERKSSDDETLPLITLMVRCVKKLTLTLHGAGGAQAMLTMRPSPYLPRTMDANEPKLPSALSLRRGVTACRSMLSTASKSCANWTCRIDLANLDKVLWFINGRRYLTTTNT